jgi:mutator protein MutT
MSTQDSKRRSERPVLGVSVCIVRNNCVLLVQRANPPFPNLWSLPGGRVEAGEGLAEAALREVREETGLVPELSGIFDWVEIIAPDRHFVLAVFLARWVAGEAMEAGDAKALRWVTVEDLASIDCTPGLETIIIKALR